jgi:uridine nucleosidase
MVASAASCAPPDAACCLQVPVVEGAHKSLRGVAKERIADFVHGNDGFGNTNPALAEVSWWAGRQVDWQRGAASLGSY